MSFFYKTFVLYLILCSTETFVIAWWPFSTSDESIPTSKPTSYNYDSSCQYPGNRFKCKNGNHCISNSERCNGEVDCEDSSDETEEACKDGGSPSCHTFSYHCKYGACVGDRTKRQIQCDGKIDCIDKSDEKDCDTGPTHIEKSDPLTCKLPRHPVNGRFTSNRISYLLYAPGQIVSETTKISLACKEGYVLNSYLARNRVCSNGKWIGGPIHGDLCIEHLNYKKNCPILDDPSYIASCQLNGRDIDCSDAVEGATASTRCSLYFRPDYYRPRMVCNNGSWTPHVGICYPECGKKRVNVKTVIIGGSNSSHGEYPWVIAIFNKAGDHICGGSIISRKYVLSAAHCFTDLRGIPHEKNDYTIAAGKHYRSLQDERDEDYKQTRKIKELFIHDLNRGFESNFIHDIALLEVSRPFKLSAGVQPVCIDWNNVHESDSFMDENEGVVAGWGFITGNDSPSEVLKKLIVPYRSKSVCKKYLNSDFYDRYFTYDKICGGYITNGSNICSGDSGSGYFFKSSGAFYIRGIASLVQQTNTSICDENNFAVYTKVSTYLSWIENITGKYL